MSTTTSPQLTCCDRHRGPIGERPATCIARILGIQPTAYWDGSSCRHVRRHLSHRWRTTKQAELRPVDKERVTCWSSSSTAAASERSRRRGESVGTCRNEGAATALCELDGVWTGREATGTVLSWAEEGPGERGREGECEVGVAGKSPSRMPACQPGGQPLPSRHLAVLFPLGRYVLCTFQSPARGARTNEASEITTGTTWAAATGRGPWGCTCLRRLRLHLEGSNLHLHFTLADADADGDGDGEQRKVAARQWSGLGSGGHWATTVEQDTNGPPARDTCFLLSRAVRYRYLGRFLPAARYPTSPRLASGRSGRQDKSRHPTAAAPHQQQHNRAPPQADQTKESASRKAASRRTEPRSTTC